MMRRPGPKAAEKTKKSGMLEVNQVVIVTETLS
jgi:hypothetical protein